MTRAARDRVTRSVPAPERDRTTWALYLLTGYFGYLETVLGPVVPFLRNEHGIDYGTASLHFGAFALGGVVTGLVGDRIARRIGRGRALWLGGAGMAAGALVLIAGREPFVTIAGTLVMGFFGGLLLICIQATLSDHHPHARAAVLLESNVAASLCAIGSSLVVGAAVRVGLGWRGGPALGIALFVALAALFRSIHVPDATRDHPAGRTRRAPLPTVFWVVFAIMFLGVAVEWSFAYWGADFLVASGVAPATAAASLGAFFAAMVAGRLGGSRIARRMSDRGLLSMALVVALAGFFVFWLSPTLIGRIAGLFVAGLGIATIYPVAVSAGTRIAAPHTGTATARLSVAAGSAVLIAPVFLGGLADRVGIVTAYVTVIPLLVTGIVLTLAAVRLGHAG